MPLSPGLWIIFQTKHCNNFLSDGYWADTNNYRHPAKPKKAGL